MQQDPRNETSLLCSKHLATTAITKAKIFQSPGCLGVSVLAQKTITWRKQVTPSLQSRPAAAWPPDTAGNRLKGLQHPARGNTYAKAPEELLLTHSFGKGDSGTLTCRSGGLSEVPIPVAQGCCELRGSPWKKAQGEQQDLINLG